MPAGAERPKRIVLLTRDGPEHRYVANLLCGRFPIAQILIDDEPRRTAYQSARRFFRRLTLSRAARRLYLAALRDGAQRARAIASVLGERASGFCREDILIRVPGINSAAAHSALALNPPDILLVYGTRVVGAKTLAFARECALNLHTGISPFYRGAGAAFWPILNGELDRLGATIHECTAAIDGGAIYAIRRAVLQPQDELHEVFARCVAVGADAYVDVVSALLAGCATSVPQSALDGREYVAAMRTLWSEYRVRRLIRNGVLRSYCNTTSVSKA